MRWPVWREVLGPTLLLGGLWLIVSTCTTVFIAWQDDAYQELFNGSVEAVDAVGHLQQSVWEIVLKRLQGLDTPPDDQLPGRQKFLRAMEKAGQPMAVSELSLMREIDANYRKLQERSTIEGSNALTVNLAQQIAHDCQSLIERNEITIDERRRAFRRHTQLVLTIRQVFNLLGPILGIWMGYRAASRLRNQISRISVRLEGSNVEVGDVEVSGTDRADLAFLDRLVSQVQIQFSVALKQLQDAREEVTRNERLAAVGQLAAGVAHELRNPLTSVKLLVQTGYAAGAERGHVTEGCDEGRGRGFQIILDEIERMERTIQSLLDFARPPPQRRTRHDLRQTIQRVWNLVSARATQQKVELRLDLGDEPLEIEGDAGQLQQVFVNLLLNGIEAMPGGGTLEVGIRRETEIGDPERVRYVALVTGGGPGIPPEIMERLFEPFVTTKERGTGLGLAVSRRIVEEHQGRLRAQNCTDRGAQFLVELPASSPVRIQALN